MKSIFVYGAGGFAREVAWLVESCSQVDEQYVVEGFIDDNEALQNTVLNDLPVLSLESAHLRSPLSQVVSGIGLPLLRKKTMERALEQGFRPISMVHPNVEMSRWVTLGDGVVICAGNILTTNIQVGDFVQINLDCTIGHDVLLGDYATLAPGVHVSGCVHIGQNVYIGTNASIINGTQSEPVVIGNDVTIGAGACVTKSVPDGLTVIGVPAKPIQRS